MPRTTLAVIFAIAVAGPAPAYAALFCTIPATPDGFVALRAAPDANAPITARMRADDEVQLLEGSKGPWLEVLHWRGDERLTESTRKNYRRGWAHRRYLRDCG
jgi:hypothetical protein